MSESMRASAPLEGEAPVNPYSLLEAVNNSSDTAHTGWLIFIAIMSYLLIAVAGVTHKELLLSSDIQLPVLQVKIDLTRFFLFAPIAVVLFHLGVVAQLVMLARKTIEFDYAIRILETTDRRTHPLRLELHNFFFVQAIAGPERSRVMSAFLHGLSWLTLAILPVLVLLYVQVVFLPYHDVGITWAHRAALVADMLLLALIGVFLTRPEASVLRALAAQGRARPLAFTVTTAVMLFTLMFSFLVATVPGEWLDRMAERVSAAGDRRLVSERAAYGFAIPLLGSRPDGTLLGVFERNLSVPDVDLVVDKDATPGEPTLNLRGRDLRFARLDRTDLHQADLTGADLEGASLAGADLRNVFMQCADIDELIFSGDRKAARCPTAERANFAGAKLAGARLQGAGLRGARFEGADLAGADLSHAALPGASFYNARLERAELTGGVSLQGANFATATLRGTDLTGAKLVGADFTAASMKGAVLAHALLQGARMRDADLEAADLYKANLQAADLRGARIRGATLLEARIWLTPTPERDREATQLIDLTDLAIKAPSASDLVELEGAIAEISDEDLRGRVSESVAVLIRPEGKRPWTGPDVLGWTELSTTAAAGLADSFKPRLTDYLVRLACRPVWADGSVATGIARRASGPEFRGDTALLHERLKADDCPASKEVSKRAMRRLLERVD